MCVGETVAVGVEGVFMMSRTIAKIFCMSIYSIRRFDDDDTVTPDGGSDDDAAAVLLRLLLLCFARESLECVVVVWEEPVFASCLKMKMLLFGDMP